MLLRIQIRPVAFDRAGEESLHLVVDRNAEPAHLALADPAHPIACTRSSTERVETITAVNAFLAIRGGSRKPAK